MKFEQSEMTFVTESSSSQKQSRAKREMNDVLVAYLLGPILERMDR
jgi:hypothetical protein